MGTGIEAAKRRRAKIENISLLLEREYGRPKFRRRSRLLDHLVSTILSQNTTDTNRDRAFASLKERFPDLMSIASSSPGEVADAIRAGGLAGIKSRRIHAIVRALSRPGGDLDRLKSMDKGTAREHLMSFMGVGRKTADCVLLFGMGRDAFPVDTHVHRVSRRLGFLPRGASRERAAEILERDVPPGSHYSLHVNLVAHGRRICRPGNPKCGPCSLGGLCDFRRGRRDRG